MAEPVHATSSSDEAILTETGRVTAEAGAGGREVALDDRLVRALGVPTFGLGIPRVTGLFDGTAPSEAAYWLGTLWFLALAAAIWHGNRALLLEQRRHWDWFGHPVRKVLMLLAAIVLFTAPLTVGALWAWYAWRALPVRWPAVQTVVLINVLCVVFVTHVYETVFLIKEREGDRLRVLALDRARVEAELAAFLAQVDPHFIFNSLNTLGHLIATDPVRALAFNDHLAELQRYLLRQRGNALTTLRDELQFVTDYVALMRIRFGDALHVAVVERGAREDAELPPTSLQLLVENAIKHNEVGEGHPLHVEVRLEPDAVTVVHVRQPRRSVRPSAGIGLRNLDERVRLALGRRLVIDQGEGRFSVSVPIRRPAD